jgi:adenine-specific DNA-methyltransferase
LKHEKEFCIVTVDNISKLRAHLEELFMFDAADLDFGMYRIMNAKRDEIRRFLEEDLLTQVRIELGRVESGERTSIEDELQQNIQQITRYGLDPEASPKVRELRERLDATADPSALEDEVFSLLATFFKRYYKDGDYLSLRRYKKDVYALPYEGEEVKLHWANADQYYIKSSEHFRDYAWTLPDGRRVRFRLVEADTEQNNNKAEQGKERRFVLAEEEPLAVSGDTLDIRFEYRVVADKQATLNTAAVARILSLANTQFPAWRDALNTPVPTAKDATRTLLAKHLADYTARNSFDYFIHKDLRGFLRRELDFFIKSEVMRLDDIEEADAPRVEQYLAKVRAVRRIAHKIIDMLAQVEEFQKKLWLKKKFVVETQYCVTLDRVPEALYPAIAANDAQRAEWVRLFAIDEISASTVSPGYSEPLSVEFLQANPHLVLDTRFFDAAFKTHLLAAFDDLDAQLDGVLVHSENFQALNLLQERYREQVKCIYIDPPYNSVASEILYKNGYKHSSWLSMIHSSINYSVRFLQWGGVLCATIDDYEYHRLQFILSDIFGEDNYLATVLIRNNPSGRSTVKGFAINHEYGLFYSRSDQLQELGRLPHSEQQMDRYSETEEKDGRIRRFEWENFRKSSADSNRTDRPRQFYPIVYNITTEELRIPIIAWQSASNSWELLESLSTDEVAIYPINPSGTEKVWQYGYERTKDNISDFKVQNGKNRLEVYKKKYRNEEGVLPRTWWDSPIYSARDNGTTAITNLFGDKQAFDFPKSVFAVMDVLRVASVNTEEVALDYFAGSGTTGHAVVNLNREDDGKRKYILVEMGEYFETVLKPRILKVIYSKDWRDGKPVSRQGSSHMLKYLRLESYEDTLNNLQLRRDPTLGGLLQEKASLREDYMLRYMLDMESRGSPSLSDLDAFRHPFRYMLDIAAGSVGETRPTAVDLVETFNYLLGLRVHRIDYDPQLTTVKGRNAGGERVLVVWRDMEAMPNDALLRWWGEQAYAGEDEPLGLVYVNGDNDLETQRQPGETWQLRLIEQEFWRLMFDVTGT